MTKWIAFLLCISCVESVTAQSQRLAIVEPTISRESALKRLEAAIGALKPAVASPEGQKYVTLCAKLDLSAFDRGACEKGIGSVYLKQDRLLRHCESLAARIRLMPLDQWDARIDWDVRTDVPNCEFWSGAGKP